MVTSEESIYADFWNMHEKSKFGPHEENKIHIFVFDRKKRR